MVLLPIFAGLAVGQNFDAVAAAPMSHEVLLEDDKVRLLRVTVKPGKTEPVHEHCRTSIMYFEQPQPITYTEYSLIGGKPVAGRSIDAPAMKQGMTVAAGPEPLHAITNRGPAPFVALRVEFKDPACGSSPPP
jgi:hypothetical protein